MNKIKIRAFDSVEKFNTFNSRLLEQGYTAINGDDFINNGELFGQINTYTKSNDVIFTGYSISDNLDILLYLKKFRADYKPAKNNFRGIQSNTSITFARFNSHNNNLLNVGYVEMANPILDASGYEVLEIKLFQLDGYFHISIYHNNYQSADDEKICLEMAEMLGHAILQSHGISAGIEMMDLSASVYSEADEERENREAREAVNEEGPPWDDCDDFELCYRNKGL